MFHPEVIVAYVAEQLALRLSAARWLGSGLPALEPSAVAAAATLGLGQPSVAVAVVKLEPSAALAVARLQPFAAAAVATPGPEQPGLEPSVAVAVAKLELGSALRSGAVGTRAPAMLDHDPRRGADDTSSDPDRSRSPRSHPRQ